MRVTLFTAFLVLLLAGSSYGQNTLLVTPSDTASVSTTVNTPGSTVEKVIAIKNNSASAYTVKWVPAAILGPHSWQYSICDIRNCYLFSYQVRSFYFGPDSTGTMKLSLAPSCTAGTGQLQVQIWVDGDSAATVQMLTWLINVDTANACLTSAIPGLSEHAEVHIFPNPTSSTVEVALSQIEPGTSIALYDMEGRLLYMNKEAETINNISMRTYPTGTYLLKVFSPSGVLTRKVEKI